MSRTRLLTLSLLLALGGPLAAWAQAGVDLGRDGATAPSRLLGLDELPRYRVPVLDLAQLQREDEWWAALGMPRRYAAAHAVEISPGTHGRWEDLGNGRRLWRLRIVSPGALSLNLGFHEFSLPAGARLYLYDPAGHDEIGPFTHRDNERHGQLWTPPLPTDDLILELTVPAYRQHLVELELSVINHGYAGFGQRGGKSGDCHRDTTCAEAEPWADQARSVGLLSIAGTYFCTGFLVNNTAGDARPLLLTAHHCNIRDSNAASVVVLWNHDDDRCRSEGESKRMAGDRGGRVRAQDDDQRRFQTGAYWRAGDPVTDIALLELDDPPDPALGLYWAGWDRRPVDPGATVAIHHPNTDVKQISIDLDRAVTTSYLKTDGPGNSSHLRVGGWERGTTEGGSSGAPLFDQAGRAVGVLHGGHAECGNRRPDWFGRISAAWDGGGYVGSRLREWLDPEASGALQVDGLDPADRVRDRQPRRRVRAHDQ